MQLRSPRTSEPRIQIFDASASEEAVASLQDELSAFGATWGLSASELAEKQRLGDRAAAVGRDAWKLVASSSSAAVDDAGSAALAVVQRIDDVLRERYGRNGWDGTGAPFRVVINAFDSRHGWPIEGAWWRGTHAELGPPDRKWGNLPAALDVVAHEFGHGIWGAEDLGHASEVAEAWADVFASSVDGDWQMAPRAFTPGDEVPLRDLANPRHVRLADAEGVERVEALGAVAARAAEQVGTETIGRVWMKALDTGLKDDASVAGLRDATIAAAGTLDPSGHVARVLKDSWAMALDENDAAELAAASLAAS